jgi:rsbT co-antagonist protein RsbR
MTYLPTINLSDESLTPVQAALRLRDTILDTIALPLIVYAIESPSAWRVVYISRAALQPGGPSDGGLGKLLEETLPEATVAQVRKRFERCIETNAAYTVEDSYDIGTRIMWTRSTFAPMHDEVGCVSHLLSFWSDITEQKQREQEERAEQEEIIRHQAATLAELSTPLLAISESTVVMPLVGAVDSRRVQQMMDGLLSGVSESRASIVILDITGVSVVDTQVANAFIRASMAVKLLGAQVVLTGIRPEVAQTLVGLGVDLSTIITRSTLRDGITYALGAAPMRR